MIHSTDIAKDMQDWLGTRQDTIRDFIKELALMESPSSDPEALSDLLQWLEDRMRALGMYTLRVPGTKSGGYLYARPMEKTPNQPIQLLLGHCDTVWPLRTLEMMPLREKDARLAGPGVYDMKAGIAQIFFALHCLAALDLTPKVLPVVLINSDEEVGSKESTPAIRRLARIADRAYVMEPPLGLEGKLKTTRKGLGRFTLTVYGKAAHAGLDPEKGANAIVEMALLVQQLYALNDFDRGTTVNVGLIEGGISPNTIAPESRVVLDVRVLTAVEGKRVETAIRALRVKAKGVRLEIDGGFGRPPMESTSRNRRLWTMAAKTGRVLGLELEQASAGGGSDGNTASQYTATLDGLGTPGDGAHALHEFIETDRLVERTTLLTLLLMMDPVRHT
ncbi:M20 family metallopeptidase [Robiginitalea aurantiaca]|uniref:M20 family metallopeptidase n=1 Tax=Robiginitalea aurantiaca TaxID=3056915 RepID=A0ABT7WH64_9FLAO|nr:M20 family metallopeptidase [Robiginitalea aurantiaca]MDM9632268.1 M20 family metallopeptidase [Robiginitalea aurantiaca]